MDMHHDRRKRREMDRMEMQFGGEKVKEQKAKCQHIILQFKQVLPFPNHFRLRSPRKSKGKSRGGQGLEKVRSSTETPTSKTVSRQILLC